MSAPTIQKARAIRDAAKEDPEKFGKLKESIDRTGRVNGVMSISQICAMGSDVAGLAHDDCILWLWTTNLHMREALSVTTAWGFEHKTILTWIKDRMGTGDWLRGQTEHRIMATRGHPIVELRNQSTALHAKARGHSVKPVEFYDFVEKLCPAPRYADFFSRYCHNEKWDCHGDEAPAACERTAAE
jgi:N6-adenosine-specific RNA methylase IME4